MAKGDLQRQYSLGHQVAGQAQFFKVTESSLKPLFVVILPALWAFCQFETVFWQHICLWKWQSEHMERNWIFDVFVHVYLSLRIFQSTVFGQLELYFMPLVLYAQP